MYNFQSAAKDHENSKKSLDKVRLSNPVLYLQTEILTRVQLILAPFCCIAQKHTHQPILHQ